MINISVKSIYKMSVVKRWAIIDMIKPQTVAEHSYNVAIFAQNAANVAEVQTGMFIDRGAMLTWALVHDIPETLTSDLPTSIKEDPDLKLAVDNLEHKIFPGISAVYAKIDSKIEYDLVKLADSVDAFVFARRYCIDESLEPILAEMKDKIFKKVSEIKNKFNVDLASTVEGWIWQ